MVKAKRKHQQKVIQNILTARYLPLSLYVVQMNIFRLVYNYITTLLLQFELTIIFYLLVVVCVHTILLGQYIYIEIEEVPEGVLQRLQHYGFLVCYSLYKHEQKMSVLNFNIQKHSAYSEPIKSKEQLLFQVIILLLIVLQLSYMILMSISHCLLKLCHITYILVCRRLGWIPIVPYETCF